MLGIVLFMALGYGATTVAQSSTKSMSKSSDPEMKQDSSAWKQICEKKIDLKAGHDEFVVNDPDRFTTIKLKAKDADVTLIDVKLFYKNGSTQVVSLNTPVSANNETKEIDLSGSSHLISKIDIRYKSPAGMSDMNKDNATIEVLGLTASNETTK